MSTNITLKRSAVEGKQPNTSVLELGEVAINTFDGKMFFKKDDGTEAIVVLQEVTEDNLLVDTSLFDNSTANNLSGVLSDLDEAVSTLSGGGLSQVTSDSTLNGLGTIASPLSVANNGHSHTVSNITDFGTSVNTAIDARVTQSFVNALNVDADLLDGANGTFYLDYNNFTNTPTLYTTANANNDIDARVTKAFVDALNVDADTLDGSNGTFYLDYTNFTNTPSIPQSGVDFDPVGTDNSTNVTLAGTYDYLTITGQQITLNQIDYSTDISNLPTLYTTANANTDIDARVNKAFVDALNVDADTLDGANGTFYLDYTNFTNTPTIPVSGVDFDPVGTDNSTDVTLAGTYDYLTITGQQITLNQIDYSTDISNLPTLYTTANANTDIDARVTKSFVDALNVDADLLDGANSDFYLNYTNFTNTPSIPQSGVDFDPVGTDNSTNVTLTGAYDYLTITGQQITLNQIDYSTDISNLPTLYTTSNANTDIDARVNKSFVDALNVDADTLDGQHGTYYLDFTNFTNIPDPTITLSGDATGSTTLTNLANGTITVAVTDNSHNHTVSNISDFTTGANTAIDNRVTKSFVDALNVDADTLDGINSTSFLRSDANTTMSTGFLTLAQDPTSALHAATKEYVDTIAAAGIHYHAPVRAEVIGNLTATYNNGSSGVGATLTNAGTQTAFVADGVSLDVGDRVLVYEQTNATQNGVYVVTTVGDGSSNWVLTRADDADTYAPSSPDSLGEGDAFFIKEGNTAAGELYVCNTTGTITFGTTNITFIQVAATAVYTAGNGIDLTGTVFSHTDTSSQASVNNSNGTVIQDVTLDTYGHVTGLTSYNLDDRYYTETEADSRFVNVTGDTVSGDLSLSSGADINLGSGSAINVGVSGQDDYIFSWAPLTAYGLTFNTLSTNPASGSYDFKNGSGNSIFIVPANSGNSAEFKYDGNTIFTDGYHPNADKLTTARNIALTGAVTGNANFDGSGNISISTTATSDPTLTINGDASGSATFTNLGNATLTLTIADDSHNHIISNVDGLQTALDGKLSTSGKAADSNLLDGIDSSAFLRSDTSDTVAAGRQISFYSYDAIESSTADQASLEVFQDTPGADAFMQFHVSGDFAAYFGLDGSTNDFAVGGWSMGAAKYKVWHAGNDGSGSGLDADLLDGQQGSYYLDWTNTTNKPDPTLTLAGDATGSATFTNLGNATLTVTVADDSHNHIISNVDGLQTALDGKLSTSGKAADSNLLDGLDLHTARNNEANKVVRTDGNGYIQAGWINTTSGAATGTINKIYASGDDYIRYVTPATLISQLGLWTSGNDGSASGLDADLLDGQQGSYYTNASNLNAGTVPTARLGSGTANTTTFLAGDQTWKEITSGGGTTWTVKTSNYTAVTGDGIIADTSGGTFTVTLPSSPSAGDNVIIADGGDWGSTNLTVGRNGSTIEGVAENLTLDIGSIQVHLIYSGTTWQVYAFTGPGVTVQADDNLTNATKYITWADSTSGGYEPKVSSTKLTFNPSTGTLTSTDYNSLSDVRLKDNIQDLAVDYDMLNKIRSVSFDWKDNGKFAYGFIAQELEEVAPELVNTAENTDYKSVSYTQLIPHLLEAIKDLKKQVDELKEKQ